MDAGPCWDRRRESCHSSAGLRRVCLLLLRCSLRWLYPVNTLNACIHRDTDSGSGAGCYATPEDKRANDKVAITICKRTKMKCFNVQKQKKKTEKLTIETKIVITTVAGRRGLLAGEGVTQRSRAQIQGRAHERVRGGASSSSE